MVGKWLVRYEPTNRTEPGMSFQSEREREREKREKAEEGLGNFLLDFSGLGCGGGGVISPGVNHTAWQPLHPLASQRLHPLHPWPDASRAGTGKVGQMKRHLLWNASHSWNSNKYENNPDPKRIPNI